MKEREAERERRDGDLEILSDKNPKNIAYYKQKYSDLSEVVSDK